MLAADPPGIVQPSRTDEQSGMIEIVGVRPDQVQKIDRRTYRVKPNPHSAQADTIQLLRGLPAVTVGPDDQIMLLGASNVTILVDGHSTRVDLHSLHGSDIDRIEIITNPSAQYSADGTGGIINIVLRRKQAEGLSGTLSGEISALGRANGDGTLKYKHGKWTYELEAQGDSGQTSRSSYHKLRSVEATAGGAPTINREDGGGPSRIIAGLARAKITYELDPHTNISAEGWGGGSRMTSINSAEFTGLTPDFNSFSERQRSVNAASYLIGLLTLDHKGSREGETLKGSAQLFGNPYDREERSTALSDGSSLVTVTRNKSLYAESQIDWEHPIGKNQILSMGAHWSLQEIRHHYRFTSSGNEALGGDAFDQFHGLQDTASAYATFQQQIGTWTVMPGVRTERNSRRISSPGLAQVRISRTDLFPTFHADHPLSKTLDLALSYSKRIDRPQLELLRPYPVVEDVLTIMEGNPRLRDQSTDSFEINLHYHRKKLDAGVIVYDRETSRVWSSTYSVNAAGQNVYTWANAGRQRDRGAEIDVSTPLVRRVKLSASVNLFASRVAVDSLDPNATKEAFRFTSNSTLEWDGPDRGKRPGDIAQLQWMYQSPSRRFQFRDFGWHWLSLSYTHSFNKSLSLTATADSGVLHNGHRLLAPLVQEIYTQHNRAAFKLKLMKTLGSTK